jgi:hypothetical protein
MRKLLLVMAVLAASAGAATAGANPDAQLMVHGWQQGGPTTGNTCNDIYESIPGEKCCEDLIPNTATADPELGVYWGLLMVASKASNDVEVNTVTFGVASTTGPYIAYIELCPGPGGGAPLEVPSDTWPVPPSGNSLSWSPDCLRGCAVPIMAIGVAAAGSGQICFGDTYPQQPAAVVDCQSPPGSDPLICFDCFGVAGDPGVKCPCEGPPPTGACCDEQDNCTVTIEADCVAPSEWLGAGTDCGPPNPCLEPPTATQETTWGQIKTIYR